MFFSEKFNVNKKVIEDFGTVDISLVCDIPFFVDPMLIFYSEKEEYKKLHNNIIKYFYFLKTKAKQDLSDKDISRFFYFNEIPNNWFGYSLAGNKGKALGNDYANFLYNNIEFALDTHGVSKGQHIEKVMLLEKHSGKDKISDLTVNLIKYFLCEYTQDFAKKYIDPALCKIVSVKKSYFNYDTEKFVSSKFFLPYIVNKNGKTEYILLTPFDILREDEPSINRKNFYGSYGRIRDSIENNELRFIVSSYIANEVKKYEDTQKQNRRGIKERKVRKIEEKAFQEIVNEYPILYDYYIKLQEENTEAIKTQCTIEFNKQTQKFILAAYKIISIFVQYNSEFHKSYVSEEYKEKVFALKYIIEECNGYKNLYSDGKPITRENDLRRLFRFVWSGINNKFEDDLKINILFKLTNKAALNRMFEKVKIYEINNCLDGNLIAIFYFSENEYKIAIQSITSAGYNSLINKSIILIDCRNDNKKSAPII